MAKGRERFNVREREKVMPRRERERTSMLEKEKENNG